jgi:hypothetical protein
MIYNWNQFIKEAKEKVPPRSKGLSEEEFLKIFNENCKNFSFSNDQLWRSKDKYNNLELFEPGYRNRNFGNDAEILAFPNFFNSIEDHPDYPVARKKSLIGATGKEICKFLIGGDAFLVIPFDNSEIVFCPVVDLWAMSDNRKIPSEKEKVKGKPIGMQHFVKKTYTKNFKVPFDELKNIPGEKVFTNKQYGDVSEFFTSSPCLLVHESKVNWFRNSI